MQLRRDRTRAVAGLGLVLAGLVLGLIMITLGGGEDGTVSAHFPANTGTPSPTGTLTPVTPHPALNFSLGVDISHAPDTNGNNDDCISTGVGSAGIAGGGNKCNIPPNSSFTVNVYLQSAGGIATYKGFDIRLTYSGVTDTLHDGNPDPFCNIELSSYNTGAGLAAFGCGISPAVATPTGRIATIHFNCVSSPGTITLVHGNGATTLVDSATIGHSEIDGTSESLDINCDAPTPTSTLSPTATSSPTSTPTNTPSVTNTPLFSPTPTSTPTLTATATSFPAMSLDAVGNRVTCEGTPTNPINCTVPVEATPKNGEFHLLIRTNHIPGGGYSGFNSEVFFGGLTLNGRSCLDEVVWPDRFLCQQIVTPTAAPFKQHKSRTGLFPPFSLSSYQGVLVEMNVHCPREGQFKLVLPAGNPSRTQGASYFNANETPIAVATAGQQALDLDGNTVPDNTTPVPLADALLINCQVISTATATRTRTATATATATPCPTNGCPTATSTVTPTPTFTPTVTNTVPPTTAPPPTNTPTRTNTPTATNTPPPCCESVRVDDAPRGSKVTTDSENGGDGAAATDTVETSVQIPAEGSVGIVEKLVTQPDPTGFHLIGQQVNISAPGGSAQQPIVITFWLDSSLLTGISPTSVQVFKGGVLVPNCTGPSGKASPDPCVVKRNVLTGGQSGDLQITVLTSDASAWNFGVPSTVGTLIGDVNCDREINPIDAAFLLQFVAAIINSIPCPQNADTNENGAANATDAALILQFDAGIINSLPPGLAGSSVWPSLAGMWSWLAGR